MLVLSRSRAFFLASVVAVAATVVRAQSDPPTAAEPSPAPAFTIPPATLFTPSDEPTLIVVDPSDPPSDLPSNFPTLLASDSPSEVPSDVPSSVPTTIQSSLPTLADLAGSIADYSTLYTAVLAVPDLAAALSDPANNLTVLGPINQAFAALDQDLLENLLTPAYNKHLGNLLLYHAADGVYNSTVVASLNGQSVLMLNGEELQIQVENGTNVCFTNVDLVFGCVNVPDVAASNGIFHGIDGVLKPSWVFNNLVQVASANPDFSTLVELVTVAGLAETLAGEGPYTILAPTNEAFAALPAETVESLLLPENVETLQKILLYHVIEGIVPSNLVETDSLETVEGSSVALGVTETGGLTINGGANVVAFDVLASNGIIHVIDQVLLPDVSGAATNSSSVPSATPGTPAPTRPNPCATQETALLGCYGSLGDDYDECDDCLLAALPPGSDCVEIESSMCEGIDGCPCGECSGVIYQYLECAFGNFQRCPFECDGYPFSTDAPTVAPTIPATLLPTNRIACPTEQAALSDCIASDNTEENNCDSCVFGALGDATTCEQVQEKSCSAIYGANSCSCGSCRGVMETFLDCLYRETADCPIDCD